MSQRRLSKPVRDSLKRMVFQFALENGALLPVSDKTILDAMVHEINTADAVELNISMAEDGKVCVQCNDIKYKFDDPSSVRDKP